MEFSSSALPMVHDDASRTNLRASDSLPANSCGVASLTFPPRPVNNSNSNHKTNFDLYRARGVVSNASSRIFPQFTHGLPIPFIQACDRHQSRTCISRSQHPTSSPPCDHIVPGFDPPGLRNPVWHMGDAYHSAILRHHDRRVGDLSPMFGTGLDGVGVRVEA